VTPHRVVLREAARRDIEEAVAFYVSQGAPAAAADLVECVERGLGYIARFPGAGSPRHAHVLDLAGLRSWMIDGYPYIVFYLERQDQIDVWRVPHSERDIPSWMRSDE
jgi:toxin ParE1/3/4